MSALKCHNGYNVVYEQDGGLRTWRTFASWVDFLQTDDTFKIVAEGLSDEDCVNLCRKTSVKALLDKALALFKEKNKTEETDRLTLQAELENVLLLLHHILS